jgi:hypothetical protein
MFEASSKKDFSFDLLIHTHNLNIYAHLQTFTKQIMYVTCTAM